MNKKYIIEPSRYQNQRTWAMTPAMRRARAPFFWKNLATFVGLFSLIGGVYGYAMYVTRPDDFSDIPVPPINESELASLKAKYEREAAEKKN